VEITAKTGFLFISVTPLVSTLRTPLMSNLNMSNLNMSNFGTLNTLYG